MPIHRTAFALAVVLALCAVPARADITIDIEQQGSDVVATGSGSIDLTGLTFLDTEFSITSLSPSFGLIVEGPAAGAHNDLYKGAMGPASFGDPGGFHFPTSGSGDLFGVGGSGGFIGVPQGYVSGMQLSATDTYANQTFSSLGLNPGTYTYTWGTGGRDHTLTVQVGTVPEPSTALVAAAGILVGLAMWARRCRRQGVTFHAWNTRSTPAPAPSNPARDVPRDAFHAQAV
jgi:hypothetical protein